MRFLNFQHFGLIFMAFHIYIYIYMVVSHVFRNKKIWKDRPATQLLKLPQIWILDPKHLLAPLYFFKILLNFINFQKFTFLKLVQDQKCSFSSKTDFFWRDMAKWSSLWEYSRKKLPRTGFKISVRIFLAVFMTISGSKKNIALWF